MANKLIVAPAPHVHGSESTQKIMRDVLLALTPALVFSVVAFGWSALAVTCISVASCVLFEYLIQKFLLKGPCTVSDLSAVVTGVLLAFNLPASLPWWIVVIGAFVSIAIAKMTFGGLGKNPFNPALSCVPVVRLPGADDDFSPSGRTVGRRFFGSDAAGSRQSGAGVAYVGQLSGCPFRFDPRFAG